MLEFINNNILVILFGIVCTGAVGSLIWYFATAKFPAKSKTTKNNKGEKVKPNCFLFDVINGYGLKYIDLATDLKDWSEKAKAGLKRYRYGNQLIYCLIKDLNGVYQTLDITRTLDQPPELLYRHLECKEVSVPGFLAVPMSLGEKIMSIGVMVTLAIVSLFIAYLLMNAGK